MLESIKNYDSSKPDAFIFNWDQLQKDVSNNFICLAAQDIVSWSALTKQMIFQIVEVTETCHE